MYMSAGNPEQRPGNPVVSPPAPGWPSIIAAPLPGRTHYLDECDLPMRLTARQGSAGRGRLPAGRAGRLTNERSER
jgi:hypothetical protein